MNKQYHIPKHTGDKELDHVTTLTGYSSWQIVTPTKSQSAETKKQRKIWEGLSRGTSQLNMPCAPANTWHMNSGGRHAHAPRASHLI